LAEAVPYLVTFRRLELLGEGSKSVMLIKAEKLQGCISVELLRPSKEIHLQEHAKRCILRLDNYN